MEKKLPDGLKVDLPTVGVSAVDIAEEVDWLLETIQDRDMTLCIAAMVLIAWSLAKGKVIEDPAQAQEVLGGFALWIAENGRIH